MIMIYTLKFFPAAILLLLFFGCSGSNNERETDNKNESTGITKENRSSITAEVLNVTPVTEYDFILKVKILDTEPVGELENFAVAGEEIELKPFYQIKEGAPVDYDDDVNKKIAGAVDLKEGEIISAVVSFSGGQSPAWLLLELNEKK